MSLQLLRGSATLAVLAYLYVSVVCLFDYLVIQLFPCYKVLKTPDCDLLGFSVMLCQYCVLSYIKFDCNVIVVVFVDS